jgi:hypothetical protein
MLASSPVQGLVHFAILVPDDTTDDAYAEAQAQASFAGALFEEALGGLGREGSLTLARLGELEDHGDVARLADRPIALVMTQNPSLAAEARAWAASPLPGLVERGALRAINGPDCAALGNKGVLAMLSEAADQGALDTSTASVVRELIPWTRAVRAVRAERDGQQGWLPDLMLTHQHALVLKPGEGFASDGVHIGRNLSAAAWADAVGQALAAGTWVVQDAIAADPLWLQRGDVLAPHAVNVGLVVCGEAYAGVFLRLMAMTAPGQVPAIGYAAGAVTGGVIEVGSSL